MVKYRFDIVLIYMIEFIVYINKSVKKLNISYNLFILTNIINWDRIIIS
jgi:hypothetical protein